MLVLASHAKAGWFGGMRAMGRVGMFVVAHLDFSEAGRKVRIVIVSGIVPFCQSG